MHVVRAPSQMAEEGVRRQEKAKAVERQRVLEVQKQQLERKEKRIEMEARPIRSPL